MIYSPIGIPSAPFILFLYLRVWTSLWNGSSKNVSPSLTTVTGIVPEQKPKKLTNKLIVSVKAKSSASSLLKAQVAKVGKIIASIYSSLIFFSNSSMYDFL